MSRSGATAGLPVDGAAIRAGGWDPLKHVRQRCAASDDQEARQGHKVGQDDRNQDRCCAEEGRLILNDRCSNDRRPEVTNLVPISGVLLLCNIRRRFQMLGPSSFRHVRLSLIVAAALATTSAYAARAPMASGSRSDGARLATSSQRPSVKPRPIRRHHLRLFRKTPGFDAGKVALFLLDPHPKMPDMGLSRTAAADLAAYIATLK